MNMSGDSIERSRAIESDKSNKRDNSDNIKDITKKISKRQDKIKEISIQQMHLYEIKQDINTLSEYKYENFSQGEGERITYLENNLKKLYDYRLQQLENIESQESLETKLSKYVNPRTGDTIPISPDDYKSKYGDGNTIPRAAALGVFDNINNTIYKILKNIPEEHPLQKKLERLSLHFTTTESNIEMNRTREHNMFPPFNKDLHSPKPSIGSFPNPTDTLTGRQIPPNRPYPDLSETNLQIEASISTATPIEIGSNNDGVRQSDSPGMTFLTSQEIQDNFGKIDKETVFKLKKSIASVKDRGLSKNYKAFCVEINRELDKVTALYRGKSLDTVRAKGAMVNILSSIKNNWDAFPMPNCKQFYKNIANEIRKQEDSQ